MLLSDRDARLSQEAENDPIIWLGRPRSQGVLETGVRLVGRLGVGRRFRQVEESFDVEQDFLSDVSRINGLDWWPGEGRLGRVDDQPSAAGCDRAGGDEAYVSPLAQLSEPVEAHRSIDQHDGFFSHLQLTQHGIEILGDGAIVEPVDYPIAEPDGQYASRRELPEAASSVPMAARVPVARSAGTCTCTVK